MIEIEQYRSLIQQLLTEKSQRGSNQQVKAQTIFDQTQDHYQLVYVGWRNTRRIFSAVLHLDIQDNKIWIQWNGTEDDIAAELVALGVAKQDIVLGFQGSVNLDVSFCCWNRPRVNGGLLNQVR